MEAERKGISRNIEKVAQAVFSDPASREAFLNAILEGQRRVTAVAWFAEPPAERPYSVAPKPLWLPDWIDVVGEDARPGKSPEHDEGKFYCLDLSSTFACAPLAQIVGETAVVVDMCAAPGGKGILAWRYKSPRVLIGNEVIRKRTAQLIANYKRCAIDPALVTSCDPSLVGTLLEGQSQLVIVDAPCSGQSLVLKDMAAPGAFHPATIAMNERRQRRILAHSARVVAPGGYLLYATCTFSPEENEKNVEWFLKTNPEFCSVEVSSLGAYQSALTERHAYRLFPQQGEGAGAFCCLLRRSGEINLTSSSSPDNVTEIIRPVWCSVGIPARPAPAPGRGEFKHRHRRAKEPRTKWRAR